MHTVMFPSHSRLSSIDVLQSNTLLDPQRTLLSQPLLITRSMKHELLVTPLLDLLQATDTVKAGPPATVMTLRRG